ncbi:MAG: hypothetical protein K8T91_20330 [Planctomycetes bacterium]|nr:hypothetical protein [Planctomycetota bacterium]
MEDLVVESTFGQDRARRRALIIGQQYLVYPMSPRKKKHRGRRGVIESFDDDFMPHFALVRFDDTNRLGKVDISDLMPAKPHHET